MASPRDLITKSTHHRRKSNIKLEGVKINKDAVCKRDNIHHEGSLKWTKESLRQTSLEKPIVEGSQPRKMPKQRNISYDDIEGSKPKKHTWERKTDRD